MFLAQKIVFVLQSSCTRFRWNSTKLHHRILCSTFLGLIRHLQNPFSISSNDSKISMCWKRGHNQSVIPLITTSQSILMIICYFSPYLPPSNIYFISENVRLMYFIVLISDGVDTNMVGGYWFVCRFVDTEPDFSIFSVWMSKDNSSVELNEMSKGKERKSVRRIEWKSAKCAEEDHHKKSTSVALCERDRNSCGVLTSDADINTNQYICVSKSYFCFISRNLYQNIWTDIDLNLAFRPFALIFFCFRVDPMLFLLMLMFMNCS